MSEKTLSLFIDESGDFGAFEPHSPYYIVSMVLHNQDVDISKQISGLDERLLNLGCPRHAIHTGPLIRRESVYKDDLMEHRKRLFITLFYFMTKLDIHYITCTVRKAACPDVIALIQNSRAALVPRCRSIGSVSTSLTVLSCIMTTDKLN